MKSTAMLLSLMMSLTTAHSPPAQDVSPSCDGESAPPFHSYHIHVLFYPDTEFEKANMGEFGGGVSGLGATRLTNCSCWQGRRAVQGL